ncbi:fimbrillin family protein [Bacteroides caecigallinarum]|uniref:fimbrillin family protein n=1 Tax=Bacteroides caecigallinarum TaxID=1411144 RepID=UPI00195767FB|nr:fimbrillin family protein [Bacteroides caecigallinarum]MBM6889264.1 fimbrillin family protein [Bacteroides caecigallinarum]
MNNRLPLHILSAATVLLFAATACTQDDLGGGTLPEGEYPLVIRATGLQAVATPASTRATVDGNWDGVTSVALSVGGTVKEYDVTASDADGYKTAILSSDTDPFWWTSREDITVSAWWPYGTTMPDVVVKADQSTKEGFEGSDFISAEAQTVQFDHPMLEFSHRTARITVLLKPGDGIPSVTGADVSVTGLSTDNGNPATIKTYAPDGDTYEALTAPQTVKANTPFIQVDLGGGTYYFRPHSDVVLAAGSRYTYTVSVTAKGLELAGCTIGGWTDGGGESGTAEDLGYFIQDDGSYTVYNANGLKEWAEAVQSDLSLNCTLTEDINMTGKEWTPIGNSFQTYNGTFDGQGYSITGLNASSLFGGIGESATVKNLQLVDVELYESSGGTAGIVTNNYGQVIACSVTGKIDAFSAVSGIAYANQGSITACWFDGTLKENASGGIVNYNFSIGSITACYWRANTDKGVYNNEGGTVEATKVDDSTVTWQTAVDGMNEALTDNGYQWKLGKNNLPVLQKNQ